MYKLHCKQLLLVSGLAGVLTVLGIQTAHAEFQAASQPIQTSEVETLTANLQPDPLSDQAPGSTSEPDAQTTVAQTFAPGQATRSGSSYIAVGGNIGFGDSTGLGRSNFAITSKVGLTNNLSARPGASIGNHTTFLIPITVDFPTASVIDEGRVNVAPFVGGGLAVSTGGSGLARPMITAGVDVPITNGFTAVTSANVGFFRETEVGAIVGVGYNF